tara:strand:- start:4741 stop:5019 length:279 start_codon:yes stop_codon:yes gene_type:complete
MWRLLWVLILNPAGPDESQPNAEGLWNTVKIKSQLTPLPCAQHSTMGAALDITVDNMFDSRGSKRFAIRVPASRQKGKDKLTTAEADSTDSI